ncbi:MAG: four helix bundle protein [Clostridiales bacterium]|nr:four helix bundle protein [Candidatus Coliplasma caballi]
MSFSVQIINLVKDLKSKHESVISNQIGRSGTSIGANIYEANYAQGTKDFISKLEIALKEATLRVDLISNSKHSTYFSIFNLILRSLTQSHIFWHPPKTTTSRRLRPRDADWTIFSRSCIDILREGKIVQSKPL